MEEFDAGTLSGDPVTFETTVHGPVIGYAEVDGERSRSRPSAPATARTSSTSSSTAGSRTARWRTTEDFFNAAAKTPQTFNSFYIDTDHVAEYTAGKLPIRARRSIRACRRRAPASTSGRAI